MTTEFRWRPLSPHSVAGVMRPLGVEWWIAGGEAVDLYIGRHTRTHGDIDIAILRRDLHALDELLAMWDVRIAHDGALTPWNGAALAPEMHQFWVRPPDQKEWSFEILLELSDDDSWLYRRDTRIRRKVDTLGITTADGVPYLAPEICLLYKAPPGTAIDRNAADFESLLPALSPSARDWLSQALTTAYPSHPWIARLSGAADEG